MTIKLNKGQYLFAADHPSFSIPSGDVTLSWVAVYDGLMSGDPQSIISTGNFQEANSLNLNYQAGSNTISQFLNTQSTAVMSTAAIGAAGTAWIHVLQRAGNVWSMRRVAPLGSAPIDGSAVQADGSGSRTAAAYDGPRGMYIGSRADTAANRMYDQSIGRVFCMPGLLTDLEVARLGYGEDVVAQLGKSVNWYVRLDTIEDIVDRGPSSNVFTISGAPTTSSTQPQFGYAELPTITGKPTINAPVTTGVAATYSPAPTSGSPIPTRTQRWLLAGADVGENFTPSANDAGKSLQVRQVATSGPNSVSSTSDPVTIQAAATNQITAVALDAGRVVQRSYAVTLSCIYTGVTPTSIEYALYAPTGSTLVQGWTALPGAVIGGGAGSASVILPVGGPYRLAMRSRNGSGVIAESTPTLETFLVGGVGSVIGSSSAAYLYQSESGTGFTVDPLTRTMDANDRSWGVMSSTGAATSLAAGLRAQANVPIGLLPAGVSASKLTEWLDTSGALWTRFLAQLAKAGGKLEFAYVTVGSNDASDSNWTSPETHFANMKQLIQNIRSACGQSNLPIIWVGSNRRTNIPNAQADYLRAAENMIGDEPNVSLITTVDQPMGDGTHMTATGFRNTVLRVNYVAGRKLYGDGVYVRGPKMAQAIFQDNRLRVTLTHRNGSDFTPDSGYSAITIADGADALTFTTEKFSPTTFDIVGSRNFVAPMVRYQSGANPSVTAPIFDTGATPLPLPPELGMQAIAGDLGTAPPPDTTPPVLTGTVSSSNVTSSGAVISWPAATDDIAVTGYEYSTNAGANYVNAGTSRNATLTGLAPSTTYQLRARAYDAAGNRSAPVSGSLTTAAAPDTSPPVFSGTVSATNVTANSANISWPTAIDNVAVAGYEYSINGGTSYVNAGSATSATLAALSPNTQYALRARAYDAAGNRSQPISGTFTTANTEQPVDFTPSISRTVRILPGKNAYDVGTFWTASGSASPVGAKDPNSTIDIHFDWSAWLADIGNATLSAVDFILSTGLTSVAGIPTATGGTVFVSGGSINQNVSVTCRITTATVPPRIEDRTVVFQIKEQ